MTEQEIFNNALAEYVKDIQVKIGATNHNPGFKFSEWELALTKKAFSAGWVACGKACLELAEQDAKEEANKERVKQ